MPIAFIGSYTEMITPEYGGLGKGIYTVQWQGESRKLEVVHSIPAVNPSYLTLSPDGRFLYSVTEIDCHKNPKVQAFQILEDYSLKPINEQAIEGSFACHLIYANNSILVACYGSGNVLQFPIEDGSLGMAIANHHHKGKGPNRERQDAAHTHQIVLAPNGKDVYAVDLGIDRLKAYRFDRERLVPNAKKDVFIESGGGARHAVFHPNGDYAYVLNELSGKVTVLKVDDIRSKGDDVLKVIASYDSLPADYHGQPHASAIRIHPSGKYLYAGNRGLEAITIFEIREDRLEVLEYHAIRPEGSHENVQTLREFNISPDGTYLIACHQDSNDTLLYRIESSGRLKEVAQTRELVAPACVVFHK